MPAAAINTRNQSPEPRTGQEPAQVSGGLTDLQMGFGIRWLCRENSPVVWRTAWNERRDVCLHFSGEHFIDPEKMPGRTTEGHRWDGDGTAYLVRRYEELGLDFLAGINGWFSGLLIDFRVKKAVLFNDRYGLGRIYYHQNSEAFFFSSEAKSLLAALTRTRSLDERGLAEWLSCGCVLQDRTLFSGIALLPPGSAWTFSADGSLQKDRYFSPETWESQPPLSPTEYYERLLETFPRILKRYGDGPKKIAMSLTGGLDGRMIMAWSPFGPGELPCYTFNGPVRDCADVKLARRVAQACGQTHQTLTLDDPFFTEFPQLAGKAILASDGAMDVTGAAELYLNRLARQIAPIRLTGNYGSEILRRHVAFRPRALPGELFSPDCGQLIQTAARTYAQEAAGNRLAFIAFKQVPWHHFSRFAVERSELAVRSPFLDNDLVALAFQAPLESAASLEPTLRLIADGNPRLGLIPTDRGVTYPAGGAANRLHRSVAEFLAKAEYACDYGMPGWLARADRCLTPLRLERWFLGRQKFCHFRSWYRRPLAGFVKEVLLDPRSRTRSYLNGSALEPMVAGHIRGTRNCTVEIHKLLTLELIHRLLLDPS